MKGLDGERAFFEPDVRVRAARHADHPRLEVDPADAEAAFVQVPRDVSRATPELAHARAGPESTREAIEEFTVARFVFQFSKDAICVVRCDFVIAGCESIIPNTNLPFAYGVPMTVAADGGIDTHG